MASFDWQINYLLTDLRKTDGYLAAEVKNLRRELAALDADDSLSDVGKQRNASVKRALARQKIEGLREKAAATEQKIRGVLERVERGPDLSDEAALTRQLKEDRAWARYLRALDNGRSPVEVIGMAADDPDGLRALRTELPAYLQGSIADNQGFQTQLAAVNDALDRAEGRHLSEDAREARKTGKEVDAGLYRLNLSAQQALQEADGGSPAPFVLAWSDRVDDPSVIELDAA
jgi:hypothetical protein